MCKYGVCSEYGEGTQFHSIFKCLMLVMKISGGHTGVSLD
jgi:hypothetical protein